MRNLPLTGTDETVVEAAVQAFYAHLAQHYGATRGDMTPHGQEQFHEAARRAAWEWILNNDPAPR